MVPSAHDLRVGGRSYAARMTTPTASRPTMPHDYGVPDTDTGLLSWSDVEQRLVASKHYWLSTVRPDGTPHVVPRWGVWLDDRLWYDGSPATVHATNLEANPAVTLTLEDGVRAVIVEGTSTATRADADGLGGRIAAAFAKYHDDGYAPEPNAWAGPEGGGLRVITPRKVLAWTAFPADCTRFAF